LRDSSSSSKRTDSRIGRERKTLEALISLYCRGVHRNRGALCGECRELLVYGTRRLAQCPFGAGKPTCARCPVHCYQLHKRDQIRRVMRYAGPRLSYRHPILALSHWLDGFRTVEDPRKRRRV